MKYIKKFKFILCIIIGITLGLILKEKAIMLRPIGTIFVNMIYVIIVPLVFIAVTLSIGSLKDSKKLKKIFICSGLVFSITLFITGVITTLYSLLFKPFKNMNIAIETAKLEKIDIFDKIVNMFTTNDFVSLFSKSNVLALIVFSIIIGYCVSKIKDNKSIILSLESFQKVISKYLEVIMKIAPIGIVCYLSALIGEYGSSFISSYLTIFVVYLIIGIFNILVLHTLYLLFSGGIKLIKIYYKNLLKLIVTAVSTQSSVVTMPTNIEVLNEMDLDRNLINICTPIATLINMQGNVIENTLKIFLISNLFSIPMGGILNYAFYIIVASFAGMITAGIPGGGVISNTLLVSILGFPPEALPILITIEWLLDAPATAFNILSDTSTLPIVNRVLRGKNDC